VNAPAGRIHDGLDAVMSGTTAVADDPLLDSRFASGAEHYVLGERLFKDTLMRERRCADRLATPFAVLVLDRTHQAPDDEAWAPIVDALTAVGADGDVVGWLEQDTVLGVILAGASREGALDAMRRLRLQLLTQFGDAVLHEVSMRLYIHGVDPTASGAHLPPVDLLIGAFVPLQSHPLGDAAKRLLDIVGSIALLALFSPAMLLSFLAVRLTSPGPALFRQVRIGRRGEAFTMLKFRSMRTDAGHAIHNDYVTWFITSSGQQPRSGNEVYKLTNDPRITRVGHWLRKSSFDELPQFWNVLRGDMSLVGPRPPLPFEVEKYQPWHRRRVLETKPGITGLWQVNGRSRTTFDEMVRMDLEYARTRSLWTDLKILAATPLAMVKGAC
jgi:lipopolysaccharide/colanic/teichoic acid biosynthesis glycosyltransferase